MAGRSGETLSADPYAPGPELDAALAELERLDREASPAPWSPGETWRFIELGDEAVRDSYQDPEQKRNHAAACAARNALPRLIATIRAQAVREETLLAALERLAPGTLDSVKSQLDRAVASFMEGNVAQSPAHRVRKQILLSQLACPSCAKTGIQSIVLDGYDRGWPTFKIDHFDGRKCQGVAPTDWLGIEIKAGP